MGQADHTNYEQEHPSHAPETEFFDRARRRIDEALQKVTEAEERMARNAARKFEAP